MNYHFFYLLTGIAIIVAVLYAGIRLNQKQEEDILKKL